ncbi:hypothetical protein ACFPL7_07440 [Dongia soli]|uniref:Uncharacterized protein n=1 Tax=Dongia soli TaxID=600628 RepID=A0ABU5E8X9_9PROT|nr:hypothetical protein [Dongia soli]MDY0882778.1 hypothetical protein [Dongia soli]
MKKMLLNGAGSLVIFLGVASSAGFAASPSAVGSSAEYYPAKSSTLLRVSEASNANCMTCIPISSPSVSQMIASSSSRFSPSYLASTHMAIPHMALPLKAFAVDGVENGQRNDLSRTFLLVVTALAAFSLIRRRSSSQSNKVAETDFGSTPIWARKWLERPTQGSV